MCATPWCPATLPMQSFPVRRMLHDNGAIFRAHTLFHTIAGRKDEIGQPKESKNRYDSDGSDRHT